MTTFRKAWQLLAVRERRKGGFVLLLVVLMGFIEAMGVASVMPFLAVLGNPDLVVSNRVLAGVYERFGFQSIDGFLMTLAGVAFSMLVLAAGIRSLTLLAMNRFVELCRYSVGARLLESYLGQPYMFFLDRNGADLAKSVLSEVDQLVRNVYKPALNVFAYSLVVLTMVALLVLLNPFLALLAAGVLGSAYLIAFVAVRGVLGRLGKDRAAANRERFRAAAEAFGAIKEIKLLGKEGAYLSRFLPPSLRYARHQATNTILSEIPRYVIEAIAFGGVLLLSLALMVADRDLGKVLPLLGVYVFAGYRLLPAGQNVYAGLARLRFGAAVVEAVHDDIAGGRQAPLGASPSPRLTPQRSVQLSDVTFRYPGASAPVVNDVSLLIPVGTHLGITGATGSGKTTIVDILLGLLRPTKGALLIDGEAVSEANLRCWQSALGYVTQEPFFTDATVAENIAIGIPDQDIDQVALHEAARAAGIDDFVARELSDGYRTVVGERGVRLSGGQRQRIGIARALYHRPDVLFLDEATSALDEATERDVLDAVRAYMRGKTIVTVAHRMSALRGCDSIVEVVDGSMRKTHG